ncbi:MAG: Sulfide dehydrogenase [flavocytochrome c] flavoprotein chain precursor, partial [Pseudomonadota bacterium]
MTNRRQVLQWGVAGAAALAAPHVAAQAGPHVVVIGGGFGGATAARYLKRFSPSVRVTLVEPNNEFIMCPMSNRVIHGGLSLKDISRPYARFVDRNGFKWVKAYADDIDPVKREVRAGGEKLSYDRLIVAPGVDYNYDGIEGLGTAQQQAKVPHA